MTMTKERTANVEDFLRVGCPVQFQGGTSAARLSAFIRGWSKGGFVLLELAMGSQRSRILPQQEPCVVRFVLDGLVCAFDAYVRDWRVEQHDSMFRTSWPTEVALVRVRRHQRFPLALGCTVEVEGSHKVSGEILDLSSSGAKFSLPGKFSAGQTFLCSFELPDGVSVSGLECEVCNREYSKSGTLAGCRFKSPDPEASRAIEFYLMNVVVERRQENAQSQVLIFAGSEDSAKPLAQIIEQSGWQANYTVGAMEGFCRARLTAPTILLIEQKQPDLAAIEMGRLVRKTYPRLPVYIVGSDMSGEPQALAAGLNGVVANDAKTIGELLSNHSAIE